MSEQNTATLSVPLMIVADEWEPMQTLKHHLEMREACQVDTFEEKDMPADLTRYRTVFMYIHKVMDPRVEKTLIEYALNGGCLIILHHGLASAKVNNPDWLRFTGIHIEPKEAPHHAWRVVGATTHTMVNLQPEHYITSHKVEYDRTIEYLSCDMPSRAAPYPALELPDTEVFLNQHFTDGREKTVLFGSHCVDPESGETTMQDRCVWYKAAGRGWIFYLQPGHKAGDFENENFCQIIVNCVAWSE